MQQMLKINALVLWLQSKATRMLIKLSKILKAMAVARFAETYPEREFGQQVVAQIPWGYNIVIMDKVSSL